MPAEEALIEAVTDAICVNVAFSGALCRKSHSSSYNSARRVDVKVNIFSDCALQKEQLRIIRLRLSSLVAQEKMRLSAARINISALTATSLFDYCWN